MKEAQVSVSSSNVTITTTSEKTLITSDPVKVPTRTAKILILAWAQVTTGAGTTALTPRIRRDTGGALANEGNAEEVKAAAGSTESFFTMATEDRENVDSVTYSLSVEQTGATGDDTGVQMGIAVFVL